MQTITSKEDLTKKFGATTSNASEVVREKSSSIAKEFRTFVHDVESLIKSSTDLNGEDLAKAKARINERITSAKKSLESIGETITDRASKTATSANNYVHEQPWTVIGASAAVGFLAGYLLTHRNHD